MNCTMVRGRLKWRAYSSKRGKIPLSVLWFGSLIAPIRETYGIGLLVLIMPPSDAISITSC